jgi:hypothetical protein
MSKTQSDDDPVHLRKRAIRLTDVARDVCDPKALEELERFIVELETRTHALTTTELTMTTASPYGLEIFESRTSLRDADGAAYRHVQAVPRLRQLAAVATVVLRRPFTKFRARHPYDRSATRRASGDLTCRAS